MDQPAPAPKAIHLTLHRPPWIITAVIVTLIVAALTAWWLITHTKPIPAKYRQGLNFELYYPSNLPHGYAVDRNSFKRDGKVLVFSITSPTHKNIAVSEAHIPADLDLSQHPNPAGISLPDQRNFTTAAGTAEISFWGDKLVSSLVTANTWVILNVSGLKMDDAQKITQAFTKL